MIEDEEDSAGEDLDEILAYDTTDLAYKASAISWNENGVWDNDYAQITNIVGMTNDGCP